MGSARWAWALSMLPSLLLGCVVVTTAAHSFSEDFDLDDVETVRIELPSTPIAVEGCDPELCGDEMDVEGRWLAVGVTKDEARKLAEDGGLVFDVADGFGRLVALRPVDVEDLLDLEIDLVEMRRDLDLEIRTGVGDVAIEEWSASVDIRIDAGDVDVEGGDEGVVVRTGRGRIRVDTRGIADLATNAGAVELAQLDGPRDAYIATGVGDVFVELASDEDLDLSIEARGTIEVDTERIRTMTSGSFSRRTGAARHRVRIITDWGNVEVGLRAAREQR